MMRNKELSCMLLQNMNKPLCLLKLFNLDTEGCYVHILHGAESTLFLYSEFCLDEEADCKKQQTQLLLPVAAGNKEQVRNYSCATQLHSYLKTVLAADDVHNVHNHDIDHESTCDMKTIMWFQGL